MDNSASQSQGSVSSISKTNQLFGDGSEANVPTPFVNHGSGLTTVVVGLLLWNQTRQHWVQNKTSNSQELLIREPKLNWNATYDSLLGSNKPFPRPIPLGEMIDFLVDIWEQEGLYD